ncbi:hypothetical protein HJG45_08670 [Roseicella sp. DB1501]|nr:hypothetical protein [Roseicella sp. DB1501]
MRLNDAEMAELENAAFSAGLTVSAYVRSHLAGVERPAVNPLALHDLARIALEHPAVAERIAGVIAMLR